MKHIEENNIADTELYEILDCHDYSAFDGKYNYEIIDKKGLDKITSKEPPQRGLFYVNEFKDYNIKHLR